MSQIKTCLFCKTYRTFNIHYDYSHTNHTVKDDMFEFFGYQIEDHLRPDDGICNSCMYVMDGVAKLKRYLLPMIFRLEPSYAEDKKPINLGKKWAIFASMFSEGEAPFPETRSPTPNSLVTCKKVVPYEPPPEVAIAEIERERHIRCPSTTRSEADSEIVQVFAKTRRSRRKKKGHNWTRRKNSRYSSLSSDRKSVTSSYSRKSRIQSRPTSPSPTDSLESFYPPGYVMASPDPSSTSTTLRYVDGCLQNKRTRSVSRLQEEEMSIYLKGGELHPCTEPGCTFICEDIDLMAKHKISRHHQLALFWCNFCKKKYTSSDDLEIHKRAHSAGYSCVICHREFFYDTELQEHWQEHVKKSVPCKFCGKRFVDRNVCNKHQRNVHKRKIPSRIDYDNKGVPESSSQNSNLDVRNVQARDAQNKEFMVVTLLQGQRVSED